MWRRRVEGHQSWKETDGHADTTEAAERELILAARYANSPAIAAQTVAENCLLTQSQPPSRSLLGPFNLFHRWGLPDMQKSFAVARGQGVAIR